MAAQSSPEPPTPTAGRVSEPWRSLRLAAVVYAITTLVYVALSEPSRLTSHTPYNHFALQAEAWLHGSVALSGSPPAHAAGNDFALHGGRWFVVFPPFPAVLLLLPVSIAGGAARLPDGLCFLAFAGFGPAVLFLALEKLARAGASRASSAVNVALALLFAFGTVYFFTAEQGTVWYAAHVVGVVLTALYLLWSLDAAHPWLAGTALALGFLTRAPLLFAMPLFVAETLRVTRQAAVREGAGGAMWWDSFDRVRAARLLGAFLCPILASVALALAYNAWRFGDPTEFGYRYLQVMWRPRIETWGLFHYHFLARNLGVALLGLPWIPAPGAGVPFQVGGHGLALWVTSPFLLWLLRPGSRGAPAGALWATVIAVALPSLFYQNSGWVQFGYRFSNDYAVFLFALLAVSATWQRRGFWVLGAVALAVNAFGALSFGRPAWAAFYHVERTQTVLFQPD